MKQEINEILETAKKDIPGCQDLDTLEQLRIKYTGKKSRLHSLLSQIGDLPPEQRPEMGKRLNITKKQNQKNFLLIKRMNYRNYPKKGQHRKTKLISQ